METDADAQGQWVIDQDPAAGRVAVLYQEARHGTMPRYRSHLDRCHPQKRDGPPAPAMRPDPTAGLAFPRRRAGQVGPFPPLEELVRAAVLPNGPITLTPRDFRWAWLEVGDVA